MSKLYQFRSSISLMTFLKIEIKYLFILFIPIPLSNVTLYLNFLERNNTNGWQF